MFQADNLWKTNIFRTNAQITLLREVVQAKQKPQAWELKFRLPGLAQVPLILAASFPVNFPPLSSWSPEPHFGQSDYLSPKHIKLSVLSSFVHYRILTFPGGFRPDVTSPAEASTPLSICQQRDLVCEETY